MRIAGVAFSYVYALTWMLSAAAAIANSAFSSGGKHADYEREVGSLDDGSRVPQIAPFSCGRMSVIRSTL
jgi:hypothetical protein